MMTTKTMTISTRRFMQIRTTCQMVVPTSCHFQRSWTSVLVQQKSVHTTAGSGYLAVSSTGTRRPSLGGRPCRRTALSRRVRALSTTEPATVNAGTTTLRRVVIVGSGPSGCYTAKYLQSALDKQQQSQSLEPPLRLQIDMVERLPVPYGLVRYGVAPDHPEVKNVQNDFAKLFEHQDDNDNVVRFLGNVQLGRDVHLEELRQRYHAVVLAYGCESDQTMDFLQKPKQEDLVEQEDEPVLEGILSAREFVAWYNGHPDYTHIGKAVAKALGGPTDLDRVHHDVPVVVLGHGNVALDCARVLAKAALGLFDTDLASHALPVLGGGVSHVSIVGRRGHVQGAFTIKEVRELVQLEKEGFGARFHVRQDELDQGKTEASLQELQGPQGRPKTRIDKLLYKAAASLASTEEKDTDDQTCEKQVHLRFLLNPVRVEPSREDPSALGAVICERTRLEGKPGFQRAVGTGEMERLPARLALVSIGYKGIAVEGLEPWFDSDRGVVRNEHGRVDAGSEEHLGGLYVAGWLKRGPSGIIGTNIGDAKDTVATILNDLRGQRMDLPDVAPLSSLLEDRGVQVVDWEGYQRIESKEAELGRSERQPREKIVDLRTMLDTAASRV